jgi:competence protein ComEC
VKTVQESPKQGIASRHKQIWFFAGLILACWLGVRYGTWWLCLPIGAGAILLSLRKLQKTAPIWAVLGAGAALLWVAVYFLLVLVPAQGLWNSVGTYTATAVDYPQSYGLEVTISGTRALLRSYDDLTEEEISSIKPGDTLEVTARMLDPRNVFPSSPGYYTSRGIFAVSGEVTALTVHSVEKIPLRYLPKQAGQQMRKMIQTLFQGDEQGFLLAILTGDQEALSDLTASQLSRTGLRHLVAISGLHISFLAAGIMKLPLDRHLRSIFSIGVLLFFCLMAGAGPSVVRATVMGILYLLAPFFLRDSDGFQALFAALILLLFCNPYAIESVSLQLSFAAVGGIFLVSPWLNQWLQRHKGFRRRWLRESLSTTFGATCFTLPLTMVYFQTIPLVFPLTNLLAVPAMVFLFGGGFLVTLAGFVCPPLAHLLALPVRGVLTYLFGVLSFFADAPFCAVTTHTVSYKIWGWSIFALTLVLLVRKDKRRSAGKYFALSGAMLIVFIFLNRASLTGGGLGIQVLDVGQGQSILCLSDTGAAAIDCGGVDAGTILADAMEDAAQSSLDLVVLTHFDSDHVNGLTQLLNRVNVKEIALPVWDETEENATAIEQLAREKGIPLRIVTERETLSFGQAAITLFPPVEGETSNNQGLSVQVSVENFSLLVTGDMDTEGEAQLLEREQLGKINVLIAGHHGSKTSTGEELLQALQPETAVISAGKYNSYGHPTQETLDRLIEAGCNIYRTDLQGTITITADIAEE